MLLQRNLKHGINYPRARNVMRKRVEVGVIIIIGFSLAFFLTSSIVAASIESQASALRDSSWQEVIVTLRCKFDSSASVDEDVQISLTT